MATTWGSTPRRHLVNALSVGLTVGAVAYAVAFALSAAIRRTRSPEEMLYRDRELAGLGVSSLRCAVFTTLLTLAYVGLSGTFSPGGRLIALLGAASSVSLAWLLCSMPRTFLRRISNIAGVDDEHPGHGGRWKTHRRFRNEATKDLRQSLTGWYIPGSNYSARIDSPVFVAKELAIRYGALRAEAYLHYVQLCDLAGQSEAADRIARIRFCLEEMERLRDLERQLRRLLPHDLGVLRILIQD